MKASLYCLFALLGTQIASADSIISIPIQKDTIPIGNSSKIAYGIYVKIGDGGEHRLFQLDSGNSAFAAGYSADAGSNQFWGSFNAIPGSETLYEKFGSDVVFNTINPVTANITLSNSIGSDLLALSGVRVGQVTEATDAGSIDWVTALNEGKAPLHDTYYGNFGARLSSLNTNMSTTVNAQSALFSALGQIAGVKGFSIRLDSGNETLRVIMNDSAGQNYTDQFTYASILPPSGQDPYPVSGLSTYSGEPVVANKFSVSGNDVDAATGVFDTGGTHFTIPETPELPSDVVKEDGTVYPGEEFEVFLTGAGTVDGKTFEDFILSFTTTDDSSYGKVVQGTPNSKGFYNYGQSIFEHYEVMYDLEDGVMRFRAIPEPRAFVMGALCFFGALLLRRRQSHWHG